MQEHAMHKLAMGQAGSESVRCRGIANSARPRLTEKQGGVLLYFQYVIFVGFFVLLSRKGGGTIVVENEQS